MTSASGVPVDAVRNGEDGPGEESTRPARSRGSRRTSSFGRFFLPGPTEVRSEILEAMVRPVIGHRGPEIRDLLARVAPALRAVFPTERPVCVSTSSATGLMEAAIANLARRRVLCLVGGAFGERFFRIARRCGVPADALRVEWGRPHTPELLREVLDANRGRYDLVTIVHSETSTGVLNPVRDLAAVATERDDLLVAVDGVSSVGGTPVPFDEWRLDYLLTGSQKALALPPGLAFGVASERAVARSRDAERASYYFDIAEFHRRAVENQTTNTPAISLLYALERQMEEIGREGPEARWERHRRMAERTWGWVAEAGERLGLRLGILAPEGYRSPTVTAITLPEGLSGSGIASCLARRGYTIAPGYDRLRESTIRIGHMGDHTVAQLEELLTVLEEALMDASETPG